MPNISIVGQVPLEIDHAFAITATSFDVSVNTPTTVKKGAFGPIGTARGIADVTANIRFSVPATGLEFNLSDLDARPLGFTVTYTTGANRYSLVGCHINNKGTTNDPASGNTEVSIGITATEEVQQA